MSNVLQQSKKFFLFMVNMLIRSQMKVLDLHLTPSLPFEKFLLVMSNVLHQSKKFFLFMVNMLIRSQIKVLDLNLTP